MIEKGAHASTGSSADAIRLDKALCFLRLVKTRSQAQDIIASGLVRINRQRAEKAGVALVVGDVITMALGQRTRVIRLLAIPIRRGPPPEAMRCYEVLDDTQTLDGHAQGGIADKETRVEATR